MIDALKSAGNDCFVILPSRGELCAELLALAVPFSIISFPLWTSSTRPSWFQQIKTGIGLVSNSVLVAWAIHKWKADIVVSNTVTVGVGAMGSRLANRSHVWHLQEFGGEDHGLFFVFGEALSLRLAGALSSCCLCLSEALAAKYKRFIPASKIAVVHPSMHRAFRSTENNESVGSLLPPRNGRFRCVIVGTLAEGKGQEDSILAFDLLSKAGISAELFIVGSGVPFYKRHLEELIVRKRLEGRVLLTGEVRTALPVMQASDIVLVCSRSEGFGRVTIEGMMAGKPVIGARAGATAELIADGVNGLLYTHGDPKDLADKIEYLYKNPEVAEQLGKNAQSWVDGFFTPERYSREILALLNSSLNPSVVVAASAPTA